MITKTRQSNFESIAIVEDLEETFEIKFTKDELEQGTFTVGRVYDLVISKLPYKTTNSSAKRLIFRELQTRFEPQFTRRKFRPSTPLITLFPEKHTLIAKSGLYDTVPELKHYLRLPSWARLLLGVLLLGGVVLSWRITWFLLPLVLAGFFIANKLLQRFNTLQKSATIREIVNIRAELEFTRRASLTKAYNPREVWEMVTMIIARYLSGNPKAMKPETRLVEDLGLRD